MLAVHTVIYYAGLSFPSILLFRAVCSLSGPRAKFKRLNPTAVRYAKIYILTYAFKDQYSTGLCVQKAEVGHMRLERSDLLNHQHIN